MRERERAESACPHGVQGSEPVPVLDVGNPKFLGQAYATYAELREKGGVVRVFVPETGQDITQEERDNRTAFQEIFGREVFFLGRYAEVSEVLRDERFSSCPHAAKTPAEIAQMPKMAEELRPVLTSLLTTDAPDHTRLRKLVQPCFSAQAMEALRPRIARIAEELLDEALAAAEARGEVAPERRLDLVEAFAFPLPVTVISDLLGIPVADRGKVRGWTEELFTNRGSRGIGGELRGKLGEFSAYLRALFVEKRARTSDDLISRLVHAQEDGDVLSEDELLSMVFIIYLAGHVTTVNLIGNGVFALLTHPEQLARFKAAPELSKQVVEETLRFYPPVDAVTGRVATEDVEVSGTQIPRGSHVFVGLASASHDPKRFACPEAFDLERADANRHLSFGKGIHLCLGAPLARVEGQVAFETLFRRCPELRLAVPAEEMRWGRQVLRGFDALPVLV
ncbi:putative cytochrome P450 hydroxylase [Chondromyces apiculatus DSM 436]|uniref:Putative cytochrome P450 hydroxylase n=1 Tax=Chondromyces apiculatus DSM 436 TaxID=1192034 RepID=A0A017TFS2_9BACT|nr:putative cytochrome P450 hydroxylase [Chondromyces apiculatus DSM 436]